MLLASPGSMTAAAIGAVGPEHPLQRARQLVDQLMQEQSASVHHLARELGVVRPLAECVIRTVALRGLYSFTNSCSLEEQLRYNALYRGFVGLGSGADGQIAVVSCVSEGLLLRSVPARLVLRQLLLCPEWQAIERHPLFTPDTSLKAGLGPAGGGAPGCADPRLAKIREFIIAHIGRPGLGANDLACALCISRRALYHLCAVYGTTPFRMIRSVRLECCHAYICSSPGLRKMTAVAYDHGFRDYASFSRMFKAYFGVTPSALRRRGTFTVAPRPRRVPVEFVGVARVIECRAAR
jgi:AraC-like DNA-binding protein